MKIAGAFDVSAKGEREIVITRVFDAGRDLVFDAMTRPELVSKWFGVFGAWTMPECEIDLRVGGSYRYVWSGPNGQRMRMRGVFSEVKPPERWVSTAIFEEPAYPGEVIGTNVLIEHSGKTTFTLTEQYPSREVRDQAKIMMEQGLGRSYDMLDELLAAI